MSLLITGAIGIICLALLCILFYLRRELLHQKEVIRTIDGLLLPERIANINQDLEKLSAKDRSKDIKQLKESEQHYRLLTENIQDLIWKADLDLNYTYVSPALRSFAGSMPDSLDPESLNRYFTSESLEASRQLLQEDLQRQVKALPAEVKPRRITYRLERKDGSPVWMESSVSYIYNSSQQPCEILGISRDVTERYKTEENLRSRTELFNTITQNVKDLIIIWDMNLKPTYVTPSSQTLLGYTPEELLKTSPLAKDLSSIMTTDSATRLEKDLIDRMGGWKDTPKEARNLPPLEAELLCKDGTTIWTESRTGMLRDDSNTPYGIITVTRDISQRKADEQMLQSKENLLQVIGNNIQDVITIFDLKMNPEYISAGIVDILGYSVEECLQKFQNNQDLLAIMTPESQKKAAALYDQSRQQLMDDPTTPRNDPPLELEFYRKDGSTVWMEVLTGFIRDEHMLPYSIITVSRNIEERIQSQLALQKAEEQFRSLVENLNDVSISLDTDGNYTYISPVLEHILGYTIDEVSGQNFSHFIHPDDMQHTVEKFKHAMLGESKNNVTEFRARHKDGHYIYVRFSYRLLTDGPDIIGMNGIISDISERVETEDALMRSQEKYRALVENMNEIVYSIDTQGNLTFVSPTVEAMTGYKPDEIGQKAFLEFVHPDDQEYVTQRFTDALQGGDLITDFRLICADDRIIHVRASSRLLYEGHNVIGMTGIMADITQQRKAESALQHAMEEVKALSVTDVLTGSYNRGFLNDQLPKEIARATRYSYPLSLIMCDLDHFKDVNDTYGHLAGDKILKRFVDIMKRMVRHNIDWVVRYGGEEFVIALPKTDKEGATALAKRISQKLRSKPITVEGREIKVTASFGVSCITPQDGAEPISDRVLIKEADRLLYKAKSQGRDQVVSD